MGYEINSNLRHQSFLAVHLLRQRYHQNGKGRVDDIVEGEEHGVVHGLC